MEKDEAGCVELQRFLAADVDPVQRWGCGGLWRMQPHACSTLAKIRSDSKEHTLRYSTKQSTKQVQQ